MDEAGKEIKECPECKKPVVEIKSSVQCPKHKNLAVCMKHCFVDCSYLDRSCSLAKCTYRKEELEHKKSVCINHYKNTNRPNHLP